MATVLLLFFHPGCCFAQQALLGEPYPGTIPAETEPKSKGIKSGPSTGIDPEDLNKPKLKYGYDNGFFLQSVSRNQCGGERSYRMRINGWFQLRHSYLNPTNENPMQNSIEFERLRLIFSGHVLSKSLRYFIQMDGDSDGETQVDFLDYYLVWDAGEELWGLEKGYFGLKAGKWKMPFNRTRAESGRKLSFTERSVASVFFDINRSVGVGLFGRVDLFEKPTIWRVALFNGFKTGGFLPGRAGDLDNNLAFSGRIFSDLVGEWGTDGEPDYSYHLSPAIRVGSGFAFAHQDANGPREFDNFFTIDSGDRLAAILPPGVTNYNAALYSLDANFKYRGLSLLTEYYFRTLSNFRPVFVRNLFDHGFLIQASYFLIPQKIEIMGRWSHLMGNSSTLGVWDQSADEYAAGVAWYIHGENLKIVFDATHLDGAPLTDRTLNVVAGDDGWLFRTQLQFYF